MKDDFEIKINEIICGLENTNYGSITGQIKLILYFQELLVKRKISKENLLDFFCNVNIKCNRNDEVSYDVLGEIGQNLNNSHKCKPIWEDLGESYLVYLTQITRNMFNHGTLFNECNC
jgi:hypothetical protein